MTRRRWPVVVPAALSLLAALEVAAYVLFAPVTTTPAGESAGALAAGNAVLVALAGVVVAGAAVGLAGAARATPRLVWLPAAGLALLGVVGVAIGPQVLVVALLLVVAALLAEATPDRLHRRRDGSKPVPGGRPSVPSPDGDAPPTVGSPAEGSERPAGPPPAGEAETATTDQEPTGEELSTPTGWLGRPEGGPDREVVLAAGLLVPLAALLALSALTTPVARVVVAATAAVVLGGAALSVGAVARG